PEDRRLANQDKRLKNIIISCLPNDIMKSVIKCTTTKAMWTDLVLAHEGPSKTKDTKIVALRLKFNSFKALEGKKVNGTFTRLKCLLNDLENNGVSIPQVEASSSKALISNSQFQDNDSNVEEDTRSSSEFLADLNAEFHDRDIDKTKETCFACGKLVSSEDEGVTKVKAFMAIAEEELSIRKNDARSEDHRKKLLNKFNSLNQEVSSLPGNVAHALGGKGKKKDTIVSKEVLFSKVVESPSVIAPEITSNSKSECDIQEPLPPFPKLLGAGPNETSKDDISLVDLTLTLTTSDEIKKVFDKRFVVKGQKKKSQPITSFVPNLSLAKKADSSTKNLILTLVEEVKGLKEKIKIPSNTSPSVSQLGSSISAKGKQRTCFNDHHSDECEYYPGCDIYGSIALETSYYTKKPSSNNRKQRIANKHMTGVKQYLYRYSKEPGPKVVFGDNSSGDIEGQLCDANLKVLFIKTQGTIFNQNNEVVLIAPRRRDVYVIDMSSFNDESNACFFAKASNSVNWLWHKSEDDEAISKSSTEGDEINFNENISFPNDEFIMPMSIVPQSFGNNDYFPYVLAYDPLSTNNISIPDPITPSYPITSSEPIIISSESLEFTTTDDHLVLNEHDDSKLAKDLRI
ncbi:hypothetical protein Tco_0744520, partial [Tanacetum coccineum]